MRAPVLLTVSFLLARLVSVAAQDVQVTVPTPYVPGQQGPSGDRDYGPPRVVDLESIDFHPESYQGTHVITLGTLDPLGVGYFTLKDVGAPVLIIPGHEVTASDLGPLAGHRLEVRGIMRRLRKKQYMQGVDLDLIEDPTLPVLPEQSFTLPRNSITVLAVSDRGEAGRSKSAPPAGAVVRDILEQPEEYAGKKVRILGQFRGRNLFNDLPAVSQRERADWVLKDGDRALWITGKAPRGKGWALDPDYKGDSIRWVEVVGKAEVVNGVVYVRASKVALASPPVADVGESEPPPP